MLKLVCIGCSSDSRDVWTVGRDPVVQAHVWTADTNPLADSTCGLCRHVTDAVSQWTWSDEMRQDELITSHSINISRHHFYNKHTSTLATQHKQKHSTQIISTTNNSCIHLPISSYKCTWYIVIRPHSINFFSGHQKNSQKFMTFFRTFSNQLTQ